MKRALILCTGNSCRSQMAEELWKHWGKGTWTAESAGSKPAGYVHELAVKAMREIDLDISSFKSKSVEQFVKRAFRPGSDRLRQRQGIVPHSARCAEYRALALR